MTKAKKLIEVALPIKEISAESVRDKSIRHGHISTLHLWWARRPLPVCRAVIFASLVPDPLDANCPKAFCDAVQDMLANNLLYAPYPDIPYTAIYDPMPDTLRNRLLMFIGKFSHQCQLNMLAGKSTPSKDQIQEGCLIKWESKNDPVVLRLARLLIWVAYNAERHPEASYKELATEFDLAFNAIKEAENNLYNTPNRHLASADVEAKEADLQAAIERFQNRMPSVFDPFAGGGAIPLEAARLGCRSYGNDINPVAHIIEKGSVEFPQKYGKPITYTHEEFMTLYGKEGVKLYTEKFGGMPTGNVEIPNRLSFDVEFYAKKVYSPVKLLCDELYPKYQDKTPLVILWAKTAKCSNPTCEVEIPLLRQMYLSKRRGASKKTWSFLDASFVDNKITFDIKNGECNDEGWISRGNLVCPICGNITDVKKLKSDFLSKKDSRKIISILFEKNGHREFIIPNDDYLSKFYRKIDTTKPIEEMPVEYTQAMSSCTWGINKWGDLFSDRQAFVINSFKDEINNLKCNFDLSNDYYKAIFTYLSIIVDKIIARYTEFGVWHVLQETVEHTFGRQAIPMKFEYPEMNPFSDLSGAFEGQLSSVINYINEENSFSASVNNVASGEASQFKMKSLNCIVTDPPYYDAIAYADLSDFFYVWMKKILYDVYPLTFGTPLTPKANECTALKHRHNGNETSANIHFENTLLQIFRVIEWQASDIVSIMFAHQSTEAWTTLCNSILGANMNIKGSWATDTEVKGALKTDKAFLESSVTVACRPSERNGFETFKRVKKAIETKVTEEVNALYELGFRGADLLTACFGQAVSEFGKYETVEKADGSEVTVGELLELARTAAFNALLRGFDGDEYTRFYIGWLQMNGMGDTDFDDAAKFARVGMSVNISDIFDKHLLIHTGNKQHLATYKERVVKDKLGIEASDPLIDQVHRAMDNWHSGDRGKILRHIKIVGSEASSPFWRVLASLKELLPEGDDLIQVQGLISNSADLIQHCSDEITYTQGTLFE